MHVSVKTQASRLENGRYRREWSQQIGSVKDFEIHAALLPTLICAPEFVDGGFNVSRPAVSIVYSSYECSQSRL